MEESHKIDFPGREPEERILSEEAVLLRISLHNALASASGRVGLVLEEDELDKLMVKLGVSNESLENVVQQINQYGVKPKEQ